jgi:hypothetical protein
MLISVKTFILSIYPESGIFSNKFDIYLDFKCTIIENGT